MSVEEERRYEDSSDIEGLAKSTPKRPNTGKVDALSSV